MENKKETSKPLSPIILILFGICSLSLGIELEIDLLYSLSGITMVFGFIRAAEFVIYSKDSYIYKILASLGLIIMTIGTKAYIEWLEIDIPKTWGENTVNNIAGILILIYLFMLLCFGVLFGNKQD